MARAEPTIQRILVALDASQHCLAALRTAVDMAVRLKAEVEGLFIEDINLLRVAELPFACEVSFMSPGTRRMELRRLELQMRAQAQRMRQAMAAIANTANINWSFRIVRGTVARELLTASANSDLVLLGKAGRSLLGHRQMGSTVRMLILERRGLTMVIGHGVSHTTPVILIYDGSNAARKALAAAVNLVKVSGSRLSVFIIAENKQKARSMQANVMDQLQEENLNADFRLLVSPSQAGLLQRLALEGRGPVVLSCGGGQHLEGENLCSLVSGLNNPVLLVR